MSKNTGLFRTALTLGLAIAAFGVGSTSAWAQGATPAPFNKVTVSDEVAKRTLMKAVINADTARAITDACVEWQKAQPGNVSVAVFVLSPTGEIIDSHKMDAVLPIGVETGLMKAKTALYARMPSALVAQRFNTVDSRVIRLDLGKEQGLAYYFVPGGLPDRGGQSIDRCGWSWGRKRRRNVRLSGTYKGARASAAAHAGCAACRAGAAPKVVSCI